MAGVKSTAAAHRRPDACSVPPALLAVIHRLASSSSPLASPSACSSSSSPLPSTSTPPLPPHAHLRSNWYPMLALLAYVLAPIPNFVATKCCGNDDILSTEPSGAADAGYFLTSFFVVSGFGIVLVLWHASVIALQAAVLSIFGGIFTYGAIIGYLHYFASDNDGF